MQWTNYQDENDTCWENSQSGAESPVRALLVMSKKRRKKINSNLADALDSSSGRRQVDASCVIFNQVISSSTTPNGPLLADVSSHNGWPPTTTCHCDSKYEKSTVIVNSDFYQRHNRTSSAPSSFLQSIWWKTSNEVERGNNTTKDSSFIKEDLVEFANGAEDKEKDGDILEEKEAMEMQRRHFHHLSMRRMSVLQQQSDRLEHHLCRINVLLVSMQIMLGASLTALGLKLSFTSTSLTWQDTPYWAGVPLLTSGLFCLHFCNTDRQIRRRVRTTRFFKIVAGSLSGLCVILCMTAAIMTGIHGNWLAGYARDCTDSFLLRNAPNKLTQCCEDMTLFQGNNETHTSNISFSACRCFRTQENIRQVMATYNEMSCVYVFSALKDYFILQCALLTVAAGVCLWMLLYLFRNLARRHKNTKRVGQSTLSGEANAVGSVASLTAAAAELTQLYHFRRKRLMGLSTPTSTQLRPNVAHLAEVMPNTPSSNGAVVENLSFSDPL